MLPDSLLTECSYRIYLDIPQETKNKIKQLRQDLLNELKTSSSYDEAQFPVLNEVGNLLLVQFDSLLLREDLLLKTLASVARQSDGFLLRFNRIEELPTHSFLVQATSREDLTALSKNLRKIRSAIRSETDTPFFLQDFTLALFRNLKPFQYESLLPVISATTVNIQCIAAQLILMKKHKVPDAGWQMMKKITLKKESVPEQSRLF